MFPPAPRLGETVAAEAAAVASAAASAESARVLCEAADAGNLAELERRALDGGTNPNAMATSKDTDGVEVETTALVEASFNGELEVTALLLDSGAIPSKPDSTGYTPLMAAASNGHAAVVGLLLDRGANLNAPSDSAGGTAFHCACSCNHPGCVEALVWAGCDTAAKTKAGHTGKQMAENIGNTAVLDCLHDLVAERLGEGAR